MRVRFGEFLLDSGSRQLLRQGEAIHLGPKALELLELLLSNRPNALSKVAIRDGLWPRRSETGSLALVSGTGRGRTRRSSAR